MGAHSTVFIATSVARRLYKKHVGSDEDVTHKQLEEFYDRVLDERSYNCLFVKDDSHYLKPDDRFDSTLSDALLEDYLIQHLADNPGERQNSPTAENAKLRELLAKTYSGLSTGIDFTRDSAVMIEQKLTEYHSGAWGRRQLEAEQASLRG